MSGAIGKIGVFALSNAPDEAQLKLGCENISAFFGGEVVSSCITSPGPRKLAGDDTSRANGFNRLLEDETINLLVAARGGFGITRILENLDLDRLRESGKWLCGYSDVTALLLAAWKAGCTRLFHGPMICSTWAKIHQDQGCLNEVRLFRDALEKEIRSSEKPASLEYSTTIREGSATAPILPVNLTMLISLLGTPFIPDLSGTILAIEDVNEPAHAIDRKLNQLRQNGILGSLKGLVFGHFTDAEDSEQIPEILKDYAKFVPGPVVMDFPLGHDHPSIPLRFGKISTLNAV